MKKKFNVHHLISNDIVMTSGTKFINNFKVYWPRYKWLRLLINRDST